MSTVTFAALNNALQAQEQRRFMREEGSVEETLQSKLQINRGEKDKRSKFQKKHFHSQDSFTNTSGSKGERYKEFPPCKHCGRKGHPPFKCWKRPDVKCGKCNKMGHDKKICRTKYVHKENAQMANDLEEEQLFIASCFKSNSSSDCWLIDSGCTNHMTGDEEIFRELDMSQVSKVKIDNGAYIVVKGKGAVAIESCKGTKFIFEVLFTPKIDQNLLSVGQLTEKGFKVLFEDKQCLIKDSKNNDVFKIKMKGKSFSLDPIK